MATTTHNDCPKEETYSIPPLQIPSVVELATAVCNLTMENRQLKRQLAEFQSELAFTQAMLHGEIFDFNLSNELYESTRDVKDRLIAELAATKQELADAKRESSDLMERFIRESAPRPRSPSMFRPVANAQTTYAAARRDAYRAAALRDSLRAQKAHSAPQRMSLSQGITGTPGASS